jgi:glycosyltransferase involved in cell wall biosynthesis
LKLFWHSTAPWGGSSYSVLTARTVPDIARDGHQVFVGTFYGLQGAPQTWTINKREDRTQRAALVPILPTVNAASYGVDTLLGNYKAMQADALITCMDAWVLPPNLTSQMRFCPWLPMDHEPPPQGILDALAPAIYPMCFSEWGTDLLKGRGVDAHYVPCSADSSVYRPGDQAKAREADWWPTHQLNKDSFLVTMVAANKDPGDRKGFSEAIQGFARFAAKHDDARLYIHSNWKAALDLEHMTMQCGIRDRVIGPDALGYVNGIYDDAFMVNVYQASDVLLNTAKSEGFGLPLLEAQMCGRPVAASDFSTTDELLFAGYRIQGQRDWSMGADAWRLRVYVDSVVEALEAAYADRGNEVLYKRARQGAINYDTWEVHRKYWRPALADIETIVCGVGDKLRLVTF